MTTLLPESIATIEQAQKFLTDLYNNGESYHPEDSAHDLVNDLFTPAECDKLDLLFIDIYNLNGNNGNHANPVFDPCEFLIDLDIELNKDSVFSA